MLVIKRINVTLKEIPFEQLHFPSKRGTCWEAKLSGGDKCYVNAIGDYVYYLASPSM